MKKAITIMIVISAVLFMVENTNSKSSDRVYYKIYLDSDMNSAYDIKEELMKIFKEVVSGISNESYIDIVAMEKDKFKLDNNYETSFKGKTLRVKIGNANGSVIKGEFKNDNYCVEKVKKKSIIEEIFG